MHPRTGQRVAVRLKASGDTATMKSGPLPIDALRLLQDVPPSIEQAPAGQKVARVNPDPQPAECRTDPPREAATAGLPARTLFQEPWWLDTASGGTAEEVRVEWDGRPVAALSFVRRTRGGAFRILSAPPYTHTLGPRFALPASRPTQHAMNIARVVRELRAKLPAHDRFLQQLDPADPSAFAFALAGCSVGQLFTFRVVPGQPPDDLLGQMDPATRRLVRAGQRSLVATQHADVDRFLALALRERAEGENRHDFPLLARLCEAAIRHGRGSFLSVADADGHDLACVFLAWDSEVLYYLVPFRDRVRARASANAFLIWEAMAVARERGLVFDFDGYSSIGSARFLASFGAPPIVRSLVTYRSARCVAVDFLRGLWRRETPTGLRMDFDLPVAAGNARLPARVRAGARLG